MVNFDGDFEAIDLFRTGEKRLSTIGRKYGHVVDHHNSGKIYFFVFLCTGGGLLFLSQLLRPKLQESFWAKPARPGLGKTGPLKTTRFNLGKTGANRSGQNRTR